LVIDFFLNSNYPSLDYSELGECGAASRPPKATNNNPILRKPLTEQQKVQKEIDLRNEQMKRLADPSNLR
jgi:hypothetical protein